MNLFDMVDPITMHQAESARDAAMSAVADHAERIEPGFAERAKDFVMQYLAENGPSPAESITDACIASGIRPPDKRAFGPVYMSLARAGKIFKEGTCRRRYGHGTTGGNIWKAKG